MNLTARWRSSTLRAHAVAAHVEIAVAQPQRLVGLDVVGDGERQRLRGIEHLDALRLDLDLAGGQRRILLAGQPLGHDALDAQDVLQPRLGGDAMRRGGLRRALRINDDLRQRRSGRAGR